MSRVATWRAEPLAFLEDVLSLEDGRSYGANLDAWQRQDFENAFSGAERHIWWERPRGHSKTADAAALALYHVLSAPGRRVYFAAVDRDQSALAHDSLRGFVQRSPLLRQSLKVDKWRVTAGSIDSALEVLAADAASSWGLRPSLVVVDEFQAWRGAPAEELFYSLYSALGKVPGARMLVSTTAGWDRTSLCWKLRQQVRGDPAWLFSRRDQCASWVSPDFLDQQRRILPEHVYRRLHLNEWTEAGGAFLTFAEVESIFGGASVLECREGAHFIALDVGLSHDASVAAVAHLKGQDVAIDNIKTWRGSPGERVSLPAVEAWLADASRLYSASRLLADPWQSVGLVQRLQEGGIRCEDVTFSQQYRARRFSNLLELVRTRRLRCFPHQDLKDELLRLEFREVAGNLRVDHPSGGHDDHAVAVAMAALASVQAGGHRCVIYPCRTCTPDGQDDDGDEEADMIERQRLRRAESMARMSAEDPARAVEAERRRIAAEEEEAARARRVTERTEALARAGERPWWEAF